MHLQVDIVRTSRGTYLQEYRGGGGQDSIPFSFRIHEGVASQELIEISWYDFDFVARKCAGTKLSITALKYFRYPTLFFPEILGKVRKNRQVI